MRNTLKRKLLSSLLAAAMTVSCFSALLAVPAAAEAEEREATYFEGFEDMDGYTYTASDTKVRNYNSTVTIDSETYHSGKSSFKLVSNNSSVSKTMIRVRTGNGQLQLANGNRYHMSFYYKSDSTSPWYLCYAVGLFNSTGPNNANVTDWSSYSVLEPTGANKNVYTKPIGAKADGWQRVDLVFTVSNATDANKYLLLYFQTNNQKVTCYIDDISVTKIADDDNVVIVNTPAGEKAVYGKAGDDYSAVIDRKCDDQYLAGVYSDSSYSTKVSSTEFGDETTPVTSNIPTTVYAKYADRTEHNFKFDSYDSGYKLPVKAESGCSVVLSDEQAFSGSKSLKFTGSSNSDILDANIRLDKQSGYDAKIKVGSTYLVSFKYFVNSDNTMQFYYNFAADVYQTDSLNTTPSAATGVQMVSSEGYAASKHLSGTKANGWQTQTVQFTVQKGESTTGTNPDELILCLRSSKAVGSVYIDDITVTELFDNEYAVIKNENNGNEPTVQIGYKGDSFTLDTPVYEGSEFDGWYTDSAFKNELTADKFGADETPVANYVPFTAYAKWNVRTFATFDFDNYADGYTLGISTKSNGSETGMACEIVTDSEHSYSKGNAIKFYSNDATKEVVKANIRLDKTTAYDTRITNGDTYLVTFKYFVDSDYSLQWYYNFVANKYQTDNINYSLGSSGVQMKSSEGYAASKPLSGTKADGWQTAVCQFTADTSIGDILILYVQGNKVSANVPLYIDDIVVTKLYNGEYAAQIIKNNGEEKVVCYGSEGESLPLETPQKLHYDFTGWYKDSDCTEKFEATTFGSESTPLVNNIPFAIYAGWKNATNYIDVDSEIENGSLTVDCTKETVTVNANDGYQLVPGSLKFKFTYGGKEYEKPIANPVAGDDNAYSFTGLLNDEIRVDGTIVVTAKFAEKQDITGAAVASALRQANADQTAGIRFLNRFYASEEILNSASFGAIVTPYDNIEALGITEVTLSDLEKVRGKNITADKFCNTNTTYRDYAIVITDVQDTNREFAVIPYMTYNDTIVYGTMEVRSYNDAAEYSNIGCEIYDSSVSGNAKSLNKKYVEEFSENFDGTALNTSKLRVDSTPKNSSAENVSVANGSLNLSISGTSATDYKSAYVSTNQLYNCSASSYVEIRAKLPKNAGRNTGFWLKTLAKDGTNIEIDIFETCGTTDRIQANVHVWVGEKTHYSLDSSTLGNSINGDKRKYDISDNEYHIFGLERSETAYKFYCDGNLFFTYDLTNLSQYGTEDFKDCFLNDAYILMSNSVLSTATNEQVSAMGSDTYQIDYVKSYRLSSHNMYDVLS